LKKKKSISVRRSQRIEKIDSNRAVTSRDGLKKKKNQNGDNNGSSDASLSH
jgi:hypothetical protein